VKEAEAEKTAAAPQEGQQNEVKAEEPAIAASAAVESTPEKAEDKPAEAEQPKVEEVTKPAEPEAPKTDDAGAVSAVIAAVETVVQNGVEEAESVEKIIEEEAGNLVESIQKEAEKVAADTVAAISNGLSKGKDLASEILSTETNGLDASPSNEVAAAE